jgi:hypothetical protein
MGYPITKYKVSPSASVSADDSRNLSANLWREVNEQYCADHPEIGTLEYYDFVKAPETVTNATDASAVGGWHLQDSAAGGTAESWAPGVGYGGIQTLGFTTGTDWFGGSIARTQKNVCLSKHATTPHGPVIHEARFDTTGDTLFHGFGEEVAEFLSATGTLPADTDYIGFYRIDAGDLQFVCANDNAGGTAVVYAVTIRAAAGITTDQTKYGFRVNSDHSVEISIDGVIIDRDTSGNKITVNPLALPIETLNFIHEIQRGATGDLAAVETQFDILATFVAA